MKKFKENDFNSRRMYPLETKNTQILQLSLALFSNFCIFAWMISPTTQSGGKTTQPQIRHIVCLKFLEETTADEIAEIEKRFPKLQESIDGIVSIEWGTNNSPEGLNKGFTHCFIVTFRNDAARDAYLPHLKHQAFVDVLKPMIEDVFVFDYNR